MKDLIIYSLFLILEAALDWSLDLIIIIIIIHFCSEL